MKRTDAGEYEIVELRLVAFLHQHFGGLEPATNLYIHALQKRTYYSANVST